MDRLMTPNEAAQILRISPKQVRDHLRNGTLKGIRHGINWMIRESDVRAFAPSRSAPVPDDLFFVQAAKSDGGCSDLGEFHRSDMESAGFSGFVRVADLKKPSGCSVIPNEMGVYVIVRESTVPPVFLERSIGGYFKGKDPTLPVDELKRNWISNVHVVYIGKAGGLSSAATLRSRLKQYMDFGCGKPIGHQGGRMIWQLADSDELLVGWKPLSGVEPVAVEQQMIDEFVTTYGMFPFANRRR